jgi:hypothetical protein
MTYSRTQPSPRYLAMLDQYRRLHREGEKFLGLDAEHTYPGVSLLPHVRRIKRLINLTGADRLLDYGCGKGYQYTPGAIRAEDFGGADNVLDFWDVLEVDCYDPCYERFSTLPSGGLYDGVISTDVLEHCVEEDVPWIAGEIFGYATKFVYANVACYPAKTTLPNGENAHCTVRPVEWWKELLVPLAARRPELTWEIWVQWKNPDDPASAVTEQKIGNSP